jgi:hypothetical protein
MVDLNEVGPTVAVGIGTSFAAAALAAIAVESVARQPKLRGIALRDALIRAAAQLSTRRTRPLLGWSFHAERDSVNALRSLVGVFARNMGTSVQVIQEYYGKQATAVVFATRLGD